MSRFSFFILLFWLALYLETPAPAWARLSLQRMPESLYAEAFDAMRAGRTETVSAALARGSDPVLNKVLTAYLMAQPGNDYGFDELAAFVTENPDWPGLKGIQMIAEQKIPSYGRPEQIVNWFNAYPPSTLAGFYRHMDALQAMGSTRIAQSLIRNKWIEGSFSKNDMEAFRSRYGSLLEGRDHRARLDRLLWEENASAAAAMYPLLGPAYKALGEARLALAAGKKNAPSLLKKVPASLQNDPGLLFERLRWRRLKNDDRGAVEILLGAASTLGKPEEWWKERHIIARRLMEKKNFSLAFKIVSRHGLAPGFAYAQAEFLAGWLALRPLNKPGLAEAHFRHLVQATSAPVSQARGYYWLGRTLEALGRRHEAEQAYESAAVLNTTFYGQLAITRLYAQPTIAAAAEPSIPSAVRDAFFSRDIVQAVEKLYHLGERARAETYFRAAANYASQRVEFALLLDLAYELDRPDLAVVAAKAANQKNFILRGGAYPLLAANIPTPPDIAFTHALIRQESEFRTDAGSAAGARGLMQLMPATAKNVAQRIGVSYAPQKLCDPDYNLSLGTHFIQSQIDNFDGSYILALAGYNAGPRRVREWIDLFGDPRTKDIDPVDWIELIPIYETRNYVQRIIENLQFYRARIAGEAVPLQIVQDLKR